MTCLCFLTKKCLIGFDSRHLKFQVHLESIANSLVMIVLYHATFTKRIDLWYKDSFTVLLSKETFCFSIY